MIPTCDLYSVGHVALTFHKGEVPMIIMTTQNKRWEIDLPKNVKGNSRSGFHRRLIFQRWGILRLTAKMS